jgi:NAD(P)-dependent dehydrogenase (short-subunit alcohol dehydrogenase family)
MSRALVLGGTRGLGLELCRALADDGVVPVVYGRSAEQSQELPAGSVRHELDLGDPDPLPDGGVDVEDVDFFLWVAGSFLQKPLEETSDHELQAMTRLHLTGPIAFLRQFHQRRRGPYHLITIASCSAWRLRSNEAIYCALKAAKAAFTRNFANDLLATRPGSRATLVNPGGLRTPHFWEGHGMDLGDFLDPVAVAGFIWSHARDQVRPFEEIQILRRKPVVPGAAPEITFGPRLPELPGGGL